MDAQVFEKFREIIYRESGIVLSPEKLPLLQNRIQGRLRALKLNEEQDYLKIIELDISGEELNNLIDAISTNVTHFYREAGHFVHLRKILESWKNKNSEIKIWCAAASSGEEPYTIAFEALSVLGENTSRFKILSTDICTKVLNTAVIAEYSEKIVSSVPQEIRSKYMSCTHTRDGEYWQVSQKVKEHLIFKKLNLVKFPYPLKGPLDIIFCRNVMIYFDVKTRQNILKEFNRLLTPGGYLFLSHSENLLGIETNFRKLGSSIFQKE